MLKGKILSLRESSPFLMPFLRLLDAALVTLTLYPIVVLYVGKWSGQYTDLAVVAFGMTLLVFHYANLYRPWRGQSFVGELSVLCTAWIVEVGLVMFLLFVFKQGQIFSRVALLSWFGAVPMVLLVVHVSLRKVLRLLRSSGKNLRRAVVVGAGELGLALARHIEAVPWTGIRVIGFFDDRKTTADLAGTLHHGNVVLGSISGLERYLQKNDVDFVYIALPMQAEGKIRHILQNCRTLGARLYLVPDLYAFRIFNTRLERLGSMMLLDFNPESGRKRLFDVAFSLLVILCSLPLTLPIVLLIKLSAGGPVFYGHRRITVSDREFKCLKFRHHVRGRRPQAGRDPGARPGGAARMGVDLQAEKRPPGDLAGAIPAQDEPRRAAPVHQRAARGDERGRRPAYCSAVSTMRTLCTTRPRST